MWIRGCLWGLADHKRGRGCFSSLSLFYPPCFPLSSRISCEFSGVRSGCSWADSHTHTAAGSKRRWKSTTVFQLKLQLVGVNRTLQLLKALLAPLFSSRWKLRWNLSYQDLTRSSPDQSICGCFYDTQPCVRHVHTCARGAGACAGICSRWSK